MRYCYRRSVGGGTSGEGVGGGSLLSGAEAS